MNCVHEEKYAEQCFKLISESKKKKKMYHKIEREQAIHGSLLVVENIKERISEVECIFKKVQKKSSFKKSKYCNIVPSMVIY